MANRQHSYTVAVRWTGNTGSGTRTYAGDERSHDAEGTMTEHTDSVGQFAFVVLRPHVTIAEASDAALTALLHERAHKICFIARSVNFPSESN